MSLIDFLFALLLVALGSAILYIISWLLTMAVGGIFFLAYWFARGVVALLIKAKVITLE